MYSYSLNPIQIPSNLVVFIHVILFRMCLSSIPIKTDCFDLVLCAYFFSLFFFSCSKNSSSWCFNIITITITLGRLFQHLDSIFSLALFGLYLPPLSSLPSDVLFCPISQCFGRSSASERAVLKEWSGLLRGVDKELLQALSNLQTYA